jgi:hypothetical protein
LGVLDSQLLEISDSGRMASNEGNVAALEVDGNNHDNVETVTTTTTAPATTTTTTAVPETTTETTTENIPAPSSSIQPAAETSTTPPNDAQVETAVGTETSKEKKDTEELSTSQAATATAAASTAESTAEDIPAATVIATPSTATHPPTSTEGPETVNITEEGESSDQTQPAKETAEEAGPELVITLLLTTGARHPFKIDRKYLKRRSVKVENDDPFNMSVYTLKELIWREWRAGMSQTVQLA